MAPAEDPVPVRDKDSYAIQSVNNALDVLEALAAEENDIRVSRLSEKLGMNKTSVFRLLATFENRGYVEREEHSGKYRLGLTAYEIGQKFLSRMGLLRQARPVMENLARACDEAVYLGVRRGDEVLFLDMVDTQQQVKVVSLAGRRFPLAAVAAGRVILRRSTTRPLPTTGAAAALPLPPGFEGDDNALGSGIRSVAAPLLAGDGEVPASLCLVGPDFRLGPERIVGEILPRLREAGLTISSKLGFFGDYPKSRPVPQGPAGGPSP